jgi:tetratricopeptide (TPR) repeat protein
MNRRFKRLALLMMLSVVGIGASATKAKLVARWTLDEASGNTAADSSGGDNAAAMYGTPLWLPMGGKHGGAVHFGQTHADRLEVSTKALSASQGSVSLCANLDTDPQPTRCQYFFGHGTAPFWTNRIQLYCDNGDRQLDVGLGNSHTRHTGVVTLSPGTWYHIVLTWDHGTFVVYVNGRAEARGTYAGLEGFNSVADIGNDGRTDGLQRDETLCGLIDDVSLFDHALNEYEVHGMQNQRTIVNSFLKTMYDENQEATALIAQQRYDEAIRLLQKGLSTYTTQIRQHPDNADARQRLVLSDRYYLLGQAKVATAASVEEIAAAYSRSVSESLFRPDYVPAILWLHQNRPAGMARAAIESSLRDGGISPDDIRRVSRAFASSKDWAAFECFLDVVLSNGNDTSARVDAVNESLATYDLWKDRFGEYLRARPALRSYWCAMVRKRAQGAVQEGRFAAAAEMYRNITDQNGASRDRDRDALEICKCAMLSGDYDLTLSRIRLLADNPSASQQVKAEALLLEGQAYLQTNNMDRAIDTLSRLTREHPQSESARDARFFLGYCNLLAGRNEEAARMLDEVIQERPQSSWARKARLCLCQTIETSP